MKSLSLKCLLGLVLLVVSGFAQETDSEEQLLRRRRFDRPMGAEHFAWKKRELQTPEAFSKTALAPPNFTSEKDPAWVRHYASGLNPSYDVPKAMAVDDFGNVYVTGHSSSPDLGADYVTLKYNSAGAKIWEARFNGEGNGDDLPFALCVDEAGNVYVAGASFGAGTSNDYATIKYNANGAEQWVAHYNGPGNGFDEAAALTVEANGNIFVTGRSEGRDTAEDYATIKYNSAGVEQWVARYNGPHSSHDVAVALALDAAGNVCVTGWSREPSASYYATIKYSNAGAQQWVARYTGPEHGNDAATDLAVDAAGNIYVTGASVGAGSSFDYATIKYDREGATQWVARYNAPANDYDYAYALAVDANGNVYVTGRSDNAAGSPDYATVKYDSAGREQWVSRYRAPGDSWNEATGLALDAAGNVYVSGNNGAVKYNGDGAQQWLANSSYAIALALDRLGNVHVLGTNYDPLLFLRDLNFIAAKYDQAGRAEWRVVYEGAHQRAFNRPEAMVVDAAGNAYVTGWSFAPNSERDFLTLKYNYAGEVQWTASYDYANDLDEALALAIDAEENVYVTGRSRAAGSSTSDFVTIKYCCDGIELWVARYNGTANDSDVPSALTVDAAGNVYVTGSSRGLSSDYDYLTIKYNAIGEEQWVRRYNAPANSVDIVTALALDTVNNVYVTGRSTAANAAFDFATVKYSSAGAEQWAMRYNGPADAGDAASALAVDNSGNVWVTGESDGLGTTCDYATIKYGNNGAQLFVVRYDGPRNSSDSPAALALDANGNAYVTGTSRGTTTGYDFATIKYNNAGAQQWAARYNGGGDSWDTASALVLDHGGNVYVTGQRGYSKISLPGLSYNLTDFATIKYNGAGVEEWVAYYNSPTNDADVSVAIGVDQATNVYVTGWSWGWSSNTGWSAFTTIKYASAAVAVHEEEHAAPAGFHLSQNYPNPFNPATTISYTLPRAERVTLRVFDLLGKEVATLVNERLPAGQYQAVWEAKEMESGVYFYRLQAGSFAQTRKLTLLQ